VIYLQAFIAAFMSAILRGLQNKNIIGGYKLLTFVTGALMYTVDAVTVYFIASEGFHIVFASALGAGFGYVASIRVHKVLTAKKEAELKAARKAKDRKKMLKIIRELREAGEIQ